MSVEVQEELLDYSDTEEAAVPSTPTKPTQVETSANEHDKTDSYF